MPNPKKTYPCSYCTKVFTRPSKKEQHERTHTGEKPFKCRVCGKSFTQNASLTTHLRTHTKEKPFKCDHCDKAFSQAITCEVHMRIHTGERPYKCDGCGQSFGHLTSFRMHKCGISRSRLCCPVCHTRRYTLQGSLNEHIRSAHPGGYTGPQPSTSTQEPSQISIHLQDVPGIGLIGAVTHTLTSPTTGITTSVSRIHSPEGAAFLCETTTTPAQAQTTGTQKYPIQTATVAQKKPEDSFSLSQNPQDIPIIDFDDLRQAWEKGDDPDPAW